MGVITDKTGLEIVGKIGDLNVDTSGLVQDTTAQAIKASIDALAAAVKPDASEITYDNTSSGLSADDVQGAIDEICTELIVTRTYTASYTAGGNASVALTANDFNAATPSGYTPIGISDFASQNVNITVRGVYGRATGTASMMVMRNVTSTSVTATAYVTIVYIKSIFT